MTPARVIPAFDEIEYRHPRLDLGLEAAALEQLAFERGEKTLAHRVVETVAHRTHRGPHPGLLAAPSEGERGILAALIRMTNHTVRASLSQRQVECFEHQLGAQIALHRPTHNPAAKNVEHHRQIEEAGPGGDIGYIRHPQTIGRGGTEVALDQIRHGPCLVIAHGGTTQWRPL